MVPRSIDRTSQTAARPCARASGRLSFALAVAASAMACGKDSPAPSADPAAKRPPPAAEIWYRVEILLDDEVRVPFLVAIDPDGNAGFLDNGGERLPIVVLEREPLHIRIPVRGVELKLEPDPAGGYRGAVGTAYYFHRDHEVRAVRVDGGGPEVLFHGRGAPAADLGGVWRMDIQEFGVGRAIFDQTAEGALSGTVIPPEVGDMRHMTGRVWGDRFAMAVFDGIHGFLLEGTIEEGGKRLRGRFTVMGIGSYTLDATRGNEPRYETLVTARMKPGVTRLAIPALSRPPYAGNPVIVEYFGTWCPACMDLMPELVRLRRQYAKDGLQVLAIALEPESDDAEMNRRLAEFRAAFSIDWPIEVRRTDDFFTEIPTELENATGFPLTLFVRRDGTVAAVHTGFISTAAQVEHAAAVADLDRWTQEIVRSPPSAVPPQAAPGAATRARP